MDIDTPNANTPNAGGSLNQPGRSVRTDARRSMTLAGALIGTLLPLSYAAYTYYQSVAYAESLPAESAACGMPMVGAMFAVLIGTPSIALLGALIGRGLSQIQS